MNFHRKHDVFRLAYTCCFLLLLLLLLSIPGDVARNWAWSAVTSRSKTHPEEASAVDHLGDNALHWAAFGKAPIESIQGLLNADPTMASVVNKKGHLPLHVACSCKPTVRVLDALLQAYPDGAGMATSSGSFPLHLMCDFGCTSDAMSVILQSKEARLHVWAKDRLYERRPLELLNCRKNLCDFQHTISTMRRARLRQSAIRRDGDLSSRAITELRRLEKSVQACGFVDFWRKVAILLYVEHTGEAPWMFYRRENSAKEDELMKYGSLFLHASIANQLCPPSLQEYAILLYDKLLLTPVDDDKNLPLHVAARVGTSSVLKDLVNANPQAAMVRNEQGLLPLSLLLRRNSKPGWLDGVNCVLEAFPQALAEQNVDRRFYPFILARFCSSRSTAHVVFCFLRSQPDIIL